MECQKKGFQQTEINLKKNQNQLRFMNLWNTTYERKRKLGQIKIDVEKCNSYPLGIFWVINNPYRQNRPLNGVQSTNFYQHQQFKKLFLNFQPKFNQKTFQKECWFRLKGQANILFYVDFDSQKIIHLMENQEGEKLITSQNKDSQITKNQNSQKDNLKQRHQKLKQLVDHHIKTQEQSGKSIELQIIFINRSPLCRSSSVMTIDLDQELPQFISSDKLLFRVLKLFDMFPDITIAFNSLGGGASVNNLHFHLLFKDQMIQKGKNLPIQLAQRTLLKQINRQTLSKLKYEGKYVKRLLKKEQSQLLQNVDFTVGVKIQYIDNPNHIGQSFVFSPIFAQQSQKVKKEQVSLSLSSVMVVFIDILVQKKIPFNILFSDSGSTLYLMIRDYSCNQAKFGFMEASGIMFGSPNQNPQKKLQQIIMQKKLLLIKQQKVEQIKEMAFQIFQGKAKE